MFCVPLLYKQFGKTEANLVLFIYLHFVVLFTN